MRTRERRRSRRRINDCFGAKNLTEEYVCNNWIGEGAYFEDVHVIFDNYSPRDKKERYPFHTLPPARSSKENNIIRKALLHTSTHFADRSPAQPSTKAQRKERGGAELPTEPCSP